MSVAALRFQIGARTVLSLPRRLCRVSLSLEEALAGGVPAMASLAPDEDGVLLTSVPEGAVGTFFEKKCPWFLVHVRHRYPRHYVDLTLGEAAWRAGLSANARAQIGRKAKKLGPHRIRRFRAPDDIAAFHTLARPVSATTYQEKLLDAGLPADASALLRRAAADGVRAWLLTVDDAAVAYLCCTADGATLRYDHVGHDPVWSGRSPGAVLQAAALADLFADRFARFDFTEGDGQHKRQFATGSVACADVLLLRPTLANRAALAALRGWDGAVAWAKGNPLLARLGATLRR